MKKHPTNRHVTHMFSVLRGRHVDPVSGQEADDDDLRTLERRLARALQRNKTGSAKPDGYPSGGERTRASGIANPTEAATLAQFRERADGTGEWQVTDDQVEALALGAWMDIERAAVYLASGRKKLDRLDVLSGTIGDAVHDVEACESCARIKDASGQPLFFSEMFRFTNVAGRLDRKWRLCQWCFDQVRADPPGEAALPTEDRIRQVHEGRKQRKKAS